MRDFFDQLIEVSKQDFIDKFTLQETDPNRRNDPDGFSLERILEHQQANHRYFKGLLTKKGCDNLILPNHIHPQGKTIVGGAGELFNYVTNYFLTELSKENSPCYIKSLEQSKRFFNNSQKYQEAEFI